MEDVGYGSNHLGVLVGTGNESTSLIAAIEVNDQEWVTSADLGTWENDLFLTRGEDDEKHICPLQLGTIERCVKLYSNPGETVLTPFGGIGSEGYMAVKLGRKAILIELKPEYFDVLVKNMRAAEIASKTPDLITWAEKQAEIQLEMG